jgi:hypothetical protein
VEPHRCSSVRGWSIDNEYERVRHVDTMLLPRRLSLLLLGPIATASHAGAQSHRATRDADDRTTQQGRKREHVALTSTDLPGELHDDGQCTTQPHADRTPDRSRGLSSTERLWSTMKSFCNSIYCFMNDVET